MRALFASFLSLSLLSAESIPVLIGSGSDGIFRSELDLDTGKMTEARLVGKGGSGWLKLRADKKVVISTAHTDGKGGVASWKVTADGVEPINRATYDGKGLCQATFDHTGQMVIGADYGGGKLTAWPIDQDGKLGENSALFKHEVIDKRARPQDQSRVHAAWAGPENKFVYVPDLGIDRVKIYAMSPKDGKLTPAGAGVSPPGSGPRHMKFSKDGKFAYVLNELSVSVTTFKRNADGSLTEVQTTSTLPTVVNKKEDKISCSEILVSKDGKFVYTGNRDLTGKDRDSVSVLAVQADGTLKHLQTVPSGVWIVRNIALSPNGDYLLCSGQKSNEVTTIKVDTKTGKMTPTGNSIPVKSAMCVVFP